jgi:hypothetical protein
MVVRGGCTGRTQSGIAAAASLSAGQLVRDDDIRKAIVCGPDVGKHRQKIQEFVEAGYTHVYVHQVGPDQAGFFQLYQREILSQFK